MSLPELVNGPPGTPPPSLPTPDQEEGTLKATRHSTVVPGACGHGPAPGDSSPPRAVPSRLLGAEAGWPSNLVAFTTSRKHVNRGHFPRKPGPHTRPTQQLRKSVLSDANICQLSHVGVRLPLEQFRGPPSMLDFGLTLSNSCLCGQAWAGQPTELPPCSWPHSEHACPQRQGAPLAIPASDPSESSIYILSRAAS